jgi:hypothetical protein
LCITDVYAKIQTFKYFGSEVSCENGKDIQQKLAKFVQILVIPNNTLTPTLILSMIKAYNVLALSILLYGSEIWTLRKKDKILLK